MRARSRPNCAVSFQRFDASLRNALNEVIGGYVETYATNAYRYDLSDREKELAGHTGRLRVAKFIFRACAETKAVDLSDRIVASGLDWEISGFRDLPDAGRGRVEFTAIAEVNRHEN
jgi:hypothetical protein